MSARLDSEVVLFDPTGRRVRAPAGAGGGSKKSPPAPRTPREAPDTVRSNQVGRVLDIWTEGPIQGFVTNPQEDVLLDGVALKNFPGATFDYRLGYLDQSHIGSYGLVEYVVQVNQEVKFGEPETQVSFDQDVDTIILNLYCPALFRQNLKNGDTNGNSFSWGYKIYYNGSPAPSQHHSFTVAEKSKNGFGFSKTIDLQKPFTRVDIEVYRGTADETLSSAGSKSFWSSITYQKNLKLRYPGTAYGVLSIPADLFDRIPGRSYRMRGVLLDIPTNYNPLTRTYLGDWNGTFKEEWSNNPAWAFWKVATAYRWGCGQYVHPGMLNRFSLYQIAKYCDEEVPSGRVDAGGNPVMEPRFTMNAYLQTQEEAFKVLNDISSIFLGMTFWSAGGVEFSQDRPKTADLLFNAANMVGPPNYSGTSRRARNTVAVVRWNDPENQDQIAVEYVDNERGIALYGRREKDITAVGCRSRGQARRAGKWALLTEHYQQETIDFDTDLHGTIPLPGDIFRTVDPTRTEDKIGGSRIVSSSLTTVELDREVVFEDAAYDIAIAMPDRTEIFDSTDAVGELPALAEHPAGKDANHVQVRADLDGSGNFVTEVEIRDYTEATRVLRIVNLGGVGNPIQYRVDYPRGVVMRPIAVVPGTSRSVTVSIPFVDPPAPEAVWIIAKQNETPELWQCVSVKEVAATQYNIIGVEYHEAKFAEVETGILFDDEGASGSVVAPSDLTISPVRSIVFTPEYRQNDDGARTVLYVTWQHDSPQNVREYWVRYRYNLGPWSNATSTVDRGFSIFDAQPGAYEVEVTAENHFFQRSGVMTAQYLLDEENRAGSVVITGLTVLGGSSRTEFTTPSAILTWGVNGTWLEPALTTSVPVGFDVDPDGDGFAYPDWFRDYLVRIYDVDDDDLASPIRTYTTRFNQFEYTVQMNALDRGGVAERSLVVGVVARDKYGNESREARLTISNPPPDRLSSITITGLFQSIWAEYVVPSGPDVREVLVWLSTSQGFTPSGTSPGFGNCVWSGSTSPAVLQNLVSGLDYYLRFAAVDTFAADPGELNISDEYKVQTAYIDGNFDIQKFSIREAVLGDAIIGGAKIRDLAVENAKIANLAVDTIKVAGRAITNFVEASVSATLPIFDFNNPQRGVWKKILDVSLQCLDGPVLITGLLFIEIWEVSPSVTGDQGGFTFSGQKWGQRTPTMRYRIVRNPDGADEDADGYPGVTMFSSGRLSASAPGYYLGGIISRFDSPPAGYHTYRIELMHQPDLYNAGLVSSLVGGQVTGVGNRFIPNVWLGTGSVNPDQIRVKFDGLNWTDWYNISAVDGGTGVMTVPTFPTWNGWREYEIRRMDPAYATRIGLDVQEAYVQAGQFRR